jgi:ParB family chromosome partitioning protein
MTAHATDTGASTGSTPVIAMPIRLERLAEHPLNPRGAGGWGSVGELAASIRELGVLEPLLVMEARTVTAAWLGLDPEARERLGAEDVAAFTQLPADGWVLLAGHRRAAAAREAGLTHVPVVVMYELAADPAGQVAAMAGENIAREDLGPLDEARSFAALAGAGWSQRRIAAAAGCSAGHVAKRTSLLRLPREIRQELVNGRLSVSEALEFAGLAGQDPDLALQAWKTWRRGQTWQADTAAKSVAWTRKLVADRAACAAALAQLAQDGIEVVDPARKWPRAWWQQRLGQDREVQRARKASQLVAAVEPNGEIVWYTTKPAQSPGSIAADTERRERRERGHAIKGRGLVCHQLAQAGPPAIPTGPARDTADALAQALLRAATSDATQLAGGWLTTRPGDKPAGTGRAWARELLAAGDTADAQKARIHAAWAVSLALDEVSARSTWSTWGAREAAHLGRLQAAGYQPSPWEQERLAAALADQGDDDQGDDQGAAGDPRDGWVLGPSVVDGWSLWQLHSEPDGAPALIEAAGVDIADDDVHAAQQWANEILVFSYGLEVVSWDETAPAAIEEMEFINPVWRPQIAA